MPRMVRRTASSGRRSSRCAKVSALTITTWSPVSRWGVKLGLCLPRSRRATSLASRPSTRPSASTTHQARWISEAFGLYVGTRATFMLTLRGRAPSSDAAPRATDKPTATRRKTASWSGFGQAPDAAGLPVGVVRHRPQAQPVRRRERRRLGPVAPRQDAEQLAGVLAGVTHVDQRAHDAADHLVAEGVGLDLEAQHALTQVGPARPAHVTDQ